MCWGCSALGCSQNRCVYLPEKKGNPSFGEQIEIKREKDGDKVIFHLLRGWQGNKKEESNLEGVYQDRSAGGGLQCSVKLQPEHRWSKPMGMGCALARVGVPIVFGNPSAHGQAWPGAKLWQEKASCFAFCGQCWRGAQGGPSLGSRMRRRRSTLCWEQAGRGSKAEQKEIGDKIRR